jgi:hypothetical protein
MESENSLGFTKEPSSEPWDSLIQSPVLHSIKTFYRIYV